MSADWFFCTENYWNLCATVCMEHCWLFGEQRRIVLGCLYDCSRHSVHCISYCKTKVQKNLSNIFQLAWNEKLTKCCGLHSSDPSNVWYGIYVSQSQHTSVFCYILWWLNFFYMTPMMSRMSRHLSINSSMTVETWADWIFFMKIRILAVYTDPTITSYAFAANDATIIVGRNHKQTFIDRLEHFA